MKITAYEYDSQNQITELIYQSGNSDTKTFKYAYDYAGRLLNTSINFIPQDSPEDYIVFDSYTYNQNSQINTSKFDPINLTHTNSYDSRNRITNYTCSKPDLFSYNLTYYSNSNIQTQSFTGQYKNSFSNQDNLSTSYTYDKSNRLLNANFTHTSDNTFDLTNAFDPDGNILTMQRYGSNNNLTDNFSYDYYSGTNRLKKVTGNTDQYTYDYNGNQTNDYLNNNTSIKYDHRNLITEFTRQDLTQDPPITDVTRYKYDEGGNRTRKTTYRSNEYEPSPLPEENEDLPSGWTIIKDEYYSRDVSGKEIAVYQGYNLDYWNVWGSGNVGKIKSTGMKYFYFKDHLGSIRAVINESNTIVQSQDYDPWGHLARSWDTTSADYKFTGKERDGETGYDYFGARYYDARIGRWGGVDQLFEKHIQWTPYNYVLGNPMMLIDPDGRQIDFNNFMNNGGTKSGISDIKDGLEFVTGFKFSFNNNKLDIASESNKGSSIAKDYIRQAIKNKTQVDYTENNSGTNIETGTISYNPDQIDNFDSHGGNSEKQGHGMSFIEEIIHSVDKEGHTESNFGDIGTVIIKTNDIRTQLGVGKRWSYLPFVVIDAGKIHKYIPYDKNSFDVMESENKKVNNYFFDRNSFENKLTNYIKY